MMLYSPDEIPWRTRILQFPQRMVRWLAGVGSLLVLPLELCFTFLARIVFATIERLEGLEFAAARLGWLIAWPVRIVAPSLMALIRVVATPVTWPLARLSRATNN